VRGRNWTVGPEALLGDGSFDEAHFGGCVTYDLSRKEVFAGQLGLPDGIRNDKSGRGSRGVYGGATRLVFVTEQAARFPCTIRQVRWVRRRRRDGE
jgi:hypothetical protein